MLQSQFNHITSALLQPEGSIDAVLELDITALSEKVLTDWENAVLSDVSEVNLRRYFSYQLKGISSLSDTLYAFDNISYEDQRQRCLLELIDYLYTYFYTYFDEKANAPMAFHDLLNDRLTIHLILERMEFCHVDPELRLILKNWFAEIKDNQRKNRHAFQSLFYLEHITQKLMSLKVCGEDADHVIVNLLITENFNRLSFFAFLQQRLVAQLGDHPDVISRLTFFREQKAKVLSQPEVMGRIYDPAWPSLKMMLGDWLKEEIMLAEELLNDASKTAPLSPKMVVELPVAHMAYLTRLFVDEGSYGTQNLKVIFKFYSDHFQSKRQSVISPGGFSKAYYSTDQQTAARVMALLQKMIFRIKRDFVLAMAVISIAARFYPGIH